jgi:hypothetical protein
MKLYLGTALAASIIETPVAHHRLAAAASGREEKS